MSPLITFICMVLGGLIATAGVVLLSVRSAGTIDELEAPPAAPHWRAFALVLAGCGLFFFAVLLGK